MKANRFPSRYVPIKTHCTTIQVEGPIGVVKTLALETLPVFDNCLHKPSISMEQLLSQTWPYDISVQTYCEK